MNKLGLVDSNILIYAHDRKSPFFKKVSKFLSRTVENQGIALTPQVLFETYRILTQKIKKPISSKQAWQLIDYYLSYPKVKLIIPSNGAIKQTEELCIKYHIKGVHVFDSYLVGIMIEAKIFTIYTANVRDFKIYEEIAIVNPCR